MAYHPSCFHRDTLMNLWYNSKEMVTQRENTEVRQKQIVSAARRLIVRYGSEHVTVRRMAKEIGVSEGAIYRHFKSKNDVLSFLINDIEDTLIGDIDKNFRIPLKSLEMLQNIIADHMSSIEQRKGVSFQVIAEIISLGDKKLNKKIYAVIENYISRIKNILAEGVKEGAIRGDTDLDSAALLFFGMIQGLVNIWALSQYNFNLQQRYQAVWNVFRNSISPR
jgi:AcrR family transcriptional regulator